MAIDLTGLRGYALGLARRAIKDIRRDNFRQLRNYVDLCAVLSKGSGHKLFFERLQGILEKSDSLYYPLILRGIDSVAEETACTVGVNLGIDAMTVGAHRMQQLARSGSTLAPWLSLAHAAEPGLDRLIGHREEQGQYFWVLYAADPAEAGQAVTLASRHPKTAFAVLLDAGWITPELVARLKTPRNLVIVLSLTRPEITEELHAAAQLLRSNRLLYGLALPLDDAAAQQVLHSEWQSVLAEHSLFCVYCLRGMSAEAAAAFTTAIWTQRMTTGAQTFPLLWEPDTAYISQRLAPGAWVEARTAGG